jgi:hypothetical protein
MGNADRVFWNDNTFLGTTTHRGPPEGLVVRASVGYNCFQWHKRSFRTADEMIARGVGALIRKPLVLLDVLNS